MLWAGWMLVAVAIGVLIRIDFGVAPYDVLNIGVGERLGVAPGTAMWLTGAVLVAAAWILGQRSGVATPLGFVAIGQIINVVLDVVQPLEHWGWRVGLLVPALVGLYAGVCLIIVSELGAGPTEVFMLAITRTGLDLRTARWIIELSCAATGLLLGGPVGVLTVLIVVLAAPAIAILLPVAARATSLENQELAERTGCLWPERQSFLNWGRTVSGGSEQAIGRESLTAGSRW